MTNDLHSSQRGPSVDLNTYQVMVLLVDDQIMIVEAVRRALTNQPNLEFHYCLSPHEAVSVACNLKPTVILQDLIMPGVDGLDLVRKYRLTTELNQTPIIVLSSQEDPAVKSRAFAEGANDYLVKLPDTIELVARIRYHSRAYINQLQRDEAYRALQESQQQLMLANLKLERITRIDGLTGLSNRRHFNEYLSDEWKRLNRRQEPISVLMIDVDYFKRFNDTYGHLAGDDVLVRVAEAIKRSCARSTDFTARFGGEEFVVVLSGTPQGDAEHVAQRLCEEVVGMVIPHAGSVTAHVVTISVGVATVVPQEDVTAAQLVEAADRALFRAKAAGRNQMVSATHLDIDQ